MVRENRVNDRVLVIEGFLVKHVGLLVCEDREVFFVGISL